VRGAACPLLCCVCVPPSSPRQGGFVPLLYIKEGANHMRVALFSYVKGNGVICCRAGGRPDDPCSDPATMAYLVPEQWRFEGRRAANGSDVF
jgi:hypothetical protein